MRNHLRWLSERILGYDVFISYSWSDGRDYVAALHQGLVGAGFRCFLDDREMSGGTPLKASVDRALQRSTILVLVASADAFDSSYVEEEVKAFDHLNRPIVPLNIEHFLTSYQGNTEVWEQIRDRVWIDDATGRLATGPGEEVVTQISRSYRFIRTTRWRQLLAWSLVLVFGGLAVLAEWQRREANWQKNVATARFLVSESANATRNHRTDSVLQGLLLATEALHREHKSDALAQWFRYIDFFLPKKAEIRLGEKIEALVFSPDGKELITGSSQGACFWQLPALTRSRCLKAEVGISALDIDRAGEHLVAGEPNGAVHVWQISSGRRLATFRRGNPVTDIAVSADGRQLAAAGYSEFVQLWQVDEVDTEARQLSHSGVALTVDFTTTGSLLVSGTNTGEVQIWDTANGLERHHRSTVGSISVARFTADGRVAMGQGSAQPAIWTPASSQWKELWPENFGFEIPDPNGSVLSLALSPDAQWLLTGGADQVAILRDLRDGTELARLVHDRVITAVAYSPDGELLATADFDGILRLWQVELGKRVIAKQGHHSSVSAVAYSADGRWFATGGPDKAARVWSADSGEKWLEVNHGDNVQGITWFEQRLASASDHEIVITDVQSKIEISRVKQVDRMGTAAYSPDGQRLVVGGPFGTLLLFDGQTGKFVRKLETKTNLLATSMAFFAGGQRLIVGNTNTPPLLFNTETWERITDLLPQTVSSSRVTATPSQLWMGFTKRQEAIFRHLTTSQTLILRHPADVTAIAINRHGNRIATGTTSGFLRIWSMDARSWPNFKPTTVVSPEFVSAQMAHLSSQAIGRG